MKAAVCIKHGKPGGIEIGKIRKTKAKGLLRKNGGYISTHSSPVKEKQEYLDLISDLASKGEIRPVIDRRYTLAKIRDAHVYLESGRKRGNVVVCNHGLKEELRSTAHSLCCKIYLFEIHFSFTAWLHRICNPTA